MLIIITMISKRVLGFVCRFLGLSDPDLGASHEAISTWPQNVCMWAPMEKLATRQTTYHTLPMKNGLNLEPKKLASPYWLMYLFRVMGLWWQFSITSPPFWWHHPPEIQEVENKDSWKQRTQRFRWFHRRPYGLIWSEVVNSLAQHWFGCILIHL